MRKLDILYICDNSLGLVSGEGESVRILLTNMSKKYSVGLIEPGRNFHKNPECQIFELSEYSRVKHLVKHPFKFLKYIKDISIIIKDASPKVIHTQSQVSFFIVGLLIKLGFIKKTFTLIHTDRGLHTKYSKFINRIFLLFMKHLDILITTTQFNCEHWKQAILQKYPQSGMEFKVIANTAGDIYEEFNSENLLDNKHFSIGFAGRYCDWKNWPLAEEICKLVYEKNQNIHFYMAVGCLDEKAEEKTHQMFERMKKKCGDAFHGRMNIPFVEMNKFYYDIDIFALTSNENTESFGRTLVEAMSRKTAILTTNAGGAVEVVNNEHNICLNAEEFSQKILQRAENPQFLMREKELNFKRVRKEYSLENNVSKHFELYRMINL